jgi:hypothetical protein
LFARGEKQSPKNEKIYAMFGGVEGPKGCYIGFANICSYECKSDKSDEVRFVRFVIGAANITDIALRQFCYIDSAPMQNGKNLVESKENMSNS